MPAAGSLATALSGATAEPATSWDALHTLRLPDAWQAEAIRALRDGQDVVVQAPTGAGKTYIFEQFYLQSRQSGGGASAAPSSSSSSTAGPRLPTHARRQIIFTTPTRALANDKYAEWLRKGWRVGITTGDLVANPDAPLVVATLESQQSPTAATLYVVDEYQWLGDPIRGNHYEGVLMSLPATTQLLLLSGSVANPDAVRQWLARLGRNARLITVKERPVPLEETDIDGPSHRIPARIAGHWSRRLAAALREDLGPILVFAPHRKAAENLAAGAARDIPCPHPLRLTPEQQLVAGPQLSKLLASRVAYHHSGLSYAQRAGLIEPLAKAGQLRVVVATLGLSAGVNFSLRSVLVTGTSFTAGGLPREVTPSDLLQMFGRAGRRGLDDQGYVLVTESSPRMGQARPATLRRAAPLPWRPLLRQLALGVPIESAAPEYQRRLFTTDIIPLGIEATAPLPKPLPCKLLTDTARARLVRRDRNPAPFCLTCTHRDACLALDPKPTLLWLWNRLGLLDRDLLITQRGRIVSQFVGPEGLAVAAAVEDATYPLEDMVLDFANLAAGERFAGDESRWSGRLALACGKAYKRFSYEGFLQDGIPINYGAGGAEMLRLMRGGGSRPAQTVRRNVPEAALDEHVRRGDVDRLLIEWRSLLRQIAHGEQFPEVPRWQQLQSICKAELAPWEAQGLPDLPTIPADQMKAVSHRLPVL
ncbi:hypothetical protein DB346_22445 [Verrucomicrobia bacterium LW23]|nr:hypothetical protein DB346_22445 [Verrucomicrobia bacterium LW23]